MLEKVLSFKNKLKVEGFPGIASDKMIKELDDFIKNKPSDLLIDISTNNFINDLKLSYNVKQILTTLQQVLPQEKTKERWKKALTDTKKLLYANGISFIDNKDL